MSESTSVKVKKNTLITTEGLTNEQMLDVLVNKYVEFKATELILVKKDLLDLDAFLNAAKEDESIKGEVEGLVKEYSKLMGITPAASADSKIGALLKKKS